MYCAGNRSIPFPALYFIDKADVLPAKDQPAVELNANGSASWQFPDRLAVHQG